MSAALQLDLLVWTPKSVSAVHVHPLYVGSPAVKRAWGAWRARLTTWSPVHGVDLVMDILAADSVSSAETLLHVAEYAGEIRRSAYEPRPEHRMFGIGGTTLVHVQKNEDMRMFHASLWSWVLP